MATRTFSWLSLLDSQQLAESRLDIEYEFTSRGPPGMNNMRTHENGMRVFRGKTSERGAYAEDTASASSLTWGGFEIDWNGQPLTWGDE